MAIIKNVKAREILDSRGSPTVEVDFYTDEFIVRSSVPSGASKGSYEAIELRDGGKRYGGKGVLKAVKNINEIISPKLKELDVTQQKFIDIMLSQLDGTDNKSKLGSNAILAVSIALFRAGARAKNLPLFRYISEVSEVQKMIMPKPYFNVINGGMHAGNMIDLQEYMIAPQAETFRENLRIGVEIYYKLKGILKEKYGSSAINVGDEGGFAPPLKDNEEPLKLLVKAIDKAGYNGKVKLAIDCAASVFAHHGKYILGKKSLKDKKHASKKYGMKGEKLAEFYLKMIDKYPIISIEDPFSEDDWQSWTYFLKKTKIQVVGDDLLVTNSERIKKALEQGMCNSLLLKINQIGSVSEAIQAAKLAFGNGWSVMVSHRSGETEDSFIADLSVGIGCGQIKAGAPCRGERIAKYNQLLRIEEELWG